MATQISTQQEQLKYRGEVWFLSAGWRGPGQDRRGPRDRLKSAELSVPALTRRRYGPPARRFSPAGFSFAVAGRGELLQRFKAMLRSEGARGRKSGSPALFAPSFKVQGNTTHNQNSWFVVAPGLEPQLARASKGPAGESAAPQVLMVSLIMAGLFTGKRTGRSASWEHVRIGSSIL